MGPSVAPFPELKVSQGGYEAGLNQNETGPETLSSPVKVLV